MKVGSLEEGTKTMAAALRDRLGSKSGRRPPKEGEKCGLSTNPRVMFDWLDAKGPFGEAGFEVEDMILQIDNLPIAERDGFVAVIAKGGTGSHPKNSDKEGFDHLMDPYGIQSLKEREEKPAKLGAHRENGGVQEYKFLSEKDERAPAFGGQRSRAGKRPRKLLLVMLSGLFFFFCPKAWGADWKYVGESPNASYYYDAKDMVRQGNVVRVWVKAVYSPEGRRGEAEKVGGDIRNVTDSRALEEINCRDKNHRAVALVVYSMEEKVVISDFRERGLDFILPDSILEGFYQTLCK